MVDVFSYVYRNVVVRFNAFGSPAETPSPNADPAVSAAEIIEDIFL